MKKRDRRQWVFTATPAILVALVIIGVSTVVAKAGEPETTTGIASPVVHTATTTPTAPKTTTPHPTSAKPTKPADPLPPGAAQAAVDAVTAQAGNGVRFGAAVLDRTTGSEAGSDSTSQFYCASVLKLFLITDLLHQREEGAISLSSSDLTDIHLALTISDDASMNSLWEDFDGPQAINQLIPLAHLKDTEVTSAAEGGLWGGVLISARDVASVYQYVLTKLDTSDRNLILDDLNAAKATGYQGFNQAFGLLGPTRNGSTKAKQGWMNWHGEVMLHTTGILDGNDKVVVAILSERSGSGTDAEFEQARQEVDRATQALVKTLGPNAVD
jgi:hypothetical protein